MAVGAFSFGTLADTFGRRPMFLASVVLATVAGVASALAPNFATFVICRLLLGVGVGGNMPISFTMYSEVLPGDRRCECCPCQLRSLPQPPREVRSGRYMAFLSMFAPVGIVLAAVIQATVLRSLGWRVVLLLLALPSAMSALLTVYMVESPRFHVLQGRVRVPARARAHAGGCGGDTRARPSPPAPPSRWCVIAVPVRSRPQHEEAKAQMDEIIRVCGGPPEGPLRSRSYRLVMTRAEAAAWAADGEAGGAGAEDGGDGDGATGDAAPLLSAGSTPGGTQGPRARRRGCCRCHHALETPFRDLCARSP